MQGHVPAGPQAFLNQLDDAERQRLLAQANAAVQSAPADWCPWWCGELFMGILPPERATWLARHLAGTSYGALGLVWDAMRQSREERSALLQSALELAREQGLVSGWRNERFSYWSTHQHTPDLAIPALLDVERASFRFLGMLSHAVHVNGFMPDGRVWIARRAWSKATDPGMLDNITAGGLPSGETVGQCLQRELAEEAGIESLDAIGVQAAGFIRTTRREKEGWHDECLHTFNLTLPADFEPSNTDGEVSEFKCLTPLDLVHAIVAGEMTVDATMSLLQGLFNVNRA